MTTVGFLHTSAGHIPDFDEVVAATAASASTVHVVEVALLEAARRIGPDHADVTAGVERAIRELVGAGADRVICTCSTIGGTAESVGGRLGVDVVRVDRAMAELAVAIGERIVVLATVESTIDPTVSLLTAVADAVGATPTISVRLVADAWGCFEAADLDGYHALVADEIERVGEGADVIVLAQASMASAIELVADATVVLSSPRPAVERILAPRPG